MCINVEKMNLVRLQKCMHIYRDAYRLRVIRGCDLTALNDPRGGHPIEEERMTHGMTSLALDETRRFTRDTICMS